MIDERHDEEQTKSEINGRGTRDPIGIALSFLGRNAYCYYTKLLPVT
jgi:hypothetical protein